MVAALLVLDRGDGKNYFGSPVPRPRKRKRKWLTLERDEKGLWQVVGESDYKPQKYSGSMAVKVRENN